MILLTPAAHTQIVKELKKTKLSLLWHCCF